MSWKQNSPSPRPAHRWLAPVAVSFSTMVLGLLIHPVHGHPATLRGQDVQRRASGAIAALSSPSTRPNPQHPAKAQRPTPKARRARAGYPSSAWTQRPGERRVYRLSYTNAAETDFRALFTGRAGSGNPRSAGLTHAFQTQMEGEWVTTVLDRREQGRAEPAMVRMAFHLRQPVVRLWADGQEALVAANTLREELGRDVVVVVDRRGRVCSVQFDKGVGTLSQSVARTLLGLTQCVLPHRSATSDQWTTEEEDPSGRYIARYQVECGRRGDNGAVQTVRKTKLRYLQPRHRLQAVDQEIHPTVLPSGSLVARIDRQSGTLLDLRGSETQSMVIRAATVGRSATGLRLQHLGRQTVGAAELADLRQSITAPAGRSVARPLSATGSREASEAAIQRKELGDATLESLLSELAKVEAAAASRPGTAPLYTPLYLKLKALIYLHPECSRRLGALAARSNPKGVTAPLLTGALSAVGHPQAQAALVDALRVRSQDAATRGAVDALTQGIAALASVRNPTLLAEATMRWEAVHAPTRSLRVMAELALGTMARNLAGSAPARATRIVDEIGRKLQASPSKDEARLRLMALGNAGSVRALPLIARFTVHPSPMLRASAAAALRWIDDPSVDARLAHSLQSDPDATVRQEAAAALGVREPTAGAVVAQQRAFRTERVEGVRLTMLSNLGRARETFPELQRLIERAATRDLSPDVRKAAATLVASITR